MNDKLVEGESIDRFPVLRGVFTSETLIFCRVYHLGFHLDCSVNLVPVRYFDNLIWRFVNEKGWPELFWSNRHLPLNEAMKKDVRFTVQLISVGEVWLITYIRFYAGLAQLVTR